MEREPRAQQRLVALAGVDMNVSISALIVAVEDVSAVEGSIFRQQLVRPKATRYRLSTTPAGGQPTGIGSSIRLWFSPAARSGRRFRDQPG